MTGPSGMAGKAYNPVAGGAGGFPDPPIPTGNPKSGGSQYEVISAILVH
jgi:hypothetical protein